MPATEHRNLRSPKQFDAQQNYTTIDRISQQGPAPLQNKLEPPKYHVPANALRVDPLTLLSQVAGVWWVYKQQRNMKSSGGSTEKGRGETHTYPDMGETKHDPLDCHIFVVLEFLELVGVLACSGAVAGSAVSVFI